MHDGIGHMTPPSQMENSLGCRPPRMETPQVGEPPWDGEPLQMEEPPRMETPPMMQNPLGWRTPTPWDGEPPQMEEPPGMENPPRWRNPLDGEPPRWRPPQWRTLPPSPGNLHFNCKNTFFTCFF